MSLTEFEFIRQFLYQPNQRPQDVIKGIGDDCAILKVPDGHELAISMDTMVSGVHFPADTNTRDIGHKCLAVSLSDLAAAGARPAWVTMALTLPQLDRTWLQSFCQGFFELAQQHKVQLVGGDVTKGPLSITTQLHGFVKPGQAMSRKGAKSGDKIYVSGTIGEAALGLLWALKQLQLPQSLHAQAEQWLQHLNRPTPRVQLGLAINQITSACIDVSDGLAADLQHILEASEVGAKLELEQLPLPQGLDKKWLDKVFDQLNGWEAIISGGDDFELCFTIDPKHENSLQQLAKEMDCPITCIGEIKQASGLDITHRGQTINLINLGYQHFS